MIVECPKCGIEFENVGKWGVRQFCSRSCANSRGVRSLETKNKIAKSVCDTLGISHEPLTERFCPCSKILSSGRNHYCSRECEQKFSWEFVKQQIEQGKWHERRRLIRYLTETSGYQCVWCGNSGTHRGQSLVLQLDHIDGNSDNNFPDNLRLLCPNCHTQTDTYKSRNKNSSRAQWRRKYYHEVLVNEQQMMSS